MTEIICRNNNIVYIYIYVLYIYLFVEISIESSIDIYRMDDGVYKANESCLFERSWTMSPNSFFCLSTQSQGGWVHPKCLGNPWVEAPNFTLQPFDLAMEGFQLSTGKTSTNMEGIARIPPLFMTFLGPASLPFEPHFWSTEPDLLSRTLSCVLGWACMDFPPYGPWNPHQLLYQIDRIKSWC